MIDKTNYNLIGVISSQNDCSDFIRPVFEKEGKHYFQYGKNGVICAFKEIPKELKNRILNLNKINVTTNTTIKETYKIGDDPIIAFRIDSQNYFISDIDNFLLFITTYTTEDEMLKEDIDMFIDCVNRKNNAKKLVKQKV